MNKIMMAVLLLPSVLMGADRRGFQSLTGTTPADNGLMPFESTSSAPADIEKAQETIRGQFPDKDFQKSTEQLNKGSFGYLEIIISAEYESRQKNEQVRRNSIGQRFTRIEFPETVYAEGGQEEETRGRLGSQKAFLGAYLSSENSSPVPTTYTFNAVVSRAETPITSTPTRPTSAASTRTPSTPIAKAPAGALFDMDDASSPLGSPQ